MNESTKEALRSLAILLLIPSSIALISLSLNFKALSKRQAAYLYIPSSDEVYAISLAPKLDDNLKFSIWDSIELDYVEPTRAELLGKADDILAQIKLLRENEASFSDEYEKAIRASLRSEDQHYYALDYFIRPDEDLAEIRSLLPPIISTLYNSKNFNPLFADITYVDAAIAHRVVTTQMSPHYSSVEHPIDITIEKAILLKGRAARLIDESGMFACPAFNHYRTQAPFNDQWDGKQLLISIK